MGEVPTQTTGETTGEEANQPPTTRARTNAAPAPPNPVPPGGFGVPMEEETRALVPIKPEPETGPTMRTLSEPPSPQPSTPIAYSLVRNVARLMPSPIAKDLQKSKKARIYYTNISEFSNDFKGKLKIKAQQVNTFTTLKVQHWMGDFGTEEEAKKAAGDGGYWKQVSVPRWDSVNNKYVKKDKRHYEMISFWRAFDDVYNRDRALRSAAGNKSVSLDTINDLKKGYELYLTKSLRIRQKKYHDPKETIGAIRKLNASHKADIETTPTKIYVDDPYLKNRHVYKVYKDKMREQWIMFVFVKEKHAQGTLWRTTPAIMTDLNDAKVKQYSDNYNTFLKKLKAAESPLAQYIQNMIDSTQLATNQRERSVGWAVLSPKTNVNEWYTVPFLYNFNSNDDTTYTTHLKATLSEITSNANKPIRMRVYVNAGNLPYGVVRAKNISKQLKKRPIILDATGKPQKADPIVVGTKMSKPYAIIPFGLIDNVQYYIPYPDKAAPLNTYQPLRGSVPEMLNAFENTISQDYRNP